MEAGVSLEERTRRTRPTISINALDGRGFATTLSFPTPGKEMLCEGHIRVTKGLSGNEWVAVSGVSFLHDGFVVSRLTQ